jgi:hypothetical protein
MHHDGPHQRAQARPVDEFPARAAAARTDGDPAGVVEESIRKNDRRTPMVAAGERHE